MNSHYERESEIANEHLIELAKNSVIHIFSAIQITVIVFLEDQMPKCVFGGGGRCGGDIDMFRAQSDLRKIRWQVQLV